MKVGKETTFGLLQALEEYMVKQDRSEQEKASLQALMPLNEVAGIRVSIVQDEAGRTIYRGRIHIDSKQAGITAKEVAEGLQKGRDCNLYKGLRCTAGIFRYRSAPTSWG